MNVYMYIDLREMWQWDPVQYMVQFIVEMTQRSFMICSASISLYVPSRWSTGYGVWWRRTVGQRQQRLLELGAWQRQSCSLAVRHRDRQQHGAAGRWGAARGAGARGTWRAGEPVVQGEREDNCEKCLHQIIGCLRSFSPSVTELEQGSVQVFVAELRKSADVACRDEASHSHPPSRVNFSHQVYRSGLDVDLFYLSFMMFWLLGCS